MAKASLELMTALRVTANRVASDVRYEWGHMAHCNCGHLVQTITEMSGQEISCSIKHSLDEWTEHASDICPANGSVAELFNALHRTGFTNEDIINLEKLSDRRVLSKIGSSTYLRKNDRGDLVTYLNTMADLMEEDLAEKDLISDDLAA